MFRVDKKIISRVLTVVLVALFTWYFFAHINDFKILLNINFVFIILLISIYMSGVVINGLFMKWSIALFGKNIRFMESVRVSMISTVGNFFAPSGSGLAFRAVYLKKRHHLTYGDYVSIVFCNYILAFFVNAVVGLCAMYALRDHNSSSFVVLTVFFVILLVASLVAFFMRVSDKHVERKNKFIKVIFEMLIKITNGWQLILANKKVTFNLFTLMIINTILTVFGAYFIMNAIGIHITIAGIVLFSVIGSLSVFINITPGNLGVKEAVYIVFSTVIGLTTTQILSIALVDRTVLFVVLFLMWLIYGRKMRSSLAAQPKL